MQDSHNNSSDPHAHVIAKVKGGLTRPIVLMGMMGVGKTHLGHMLADALSLEFYDSDKVIEERGGIDIATIFELYGEARFRESEQKTLLELLQNPPCIIATGGGAPVNPAILSAIKTHGLSVWLDSSVDDIYERVKKSQHRPLLQNDNPKEVLTALLAQRKQFYVQADIHIQTQGQNATKALSEMIEALADIV